MRDEVLVLTHDVFDERFDKAVSSLWNVTSGVDILTTANYILTHHGRFYFCPNVNLEIKLKSIETIRKKISIKYGKNEIYYIENIEKLKKLNHDEIAVGSCFMFWGDKKAIDLMLDKSYIEIFESPELLKILMQFSDFFIEIHDNEWQSMCYYRHKSDWDNYLSYLKKKANIKIVDGWSYLPK